jgi:GH141 insertion domain
MAPFIASLALAVVSAVDPATADFHVAPNGNDTNPGTQQAPFASIGRARDAVREFVAAGLTKDVNVLIRGGTYTLDTPLAFAPEDSGTEDFAITYAAYPGETVLISGGRSISGWTKADGNKWTAEIPEAKDGQWPIRQLFVDGGRLPRGRFPNAPDLLRVKQVSEDVTEILLDTAPNTGDLAGQDAELVMYQNWSISRVAIASSDGAIIKLTNPMGWIGHGPATTASPHKPTYIENALAFVDQPGEWYLDRKTGVLTYMAADGEDPNTRSFVAPSLEQLVTVCGSPDAPVRNIRFQGLTFAHTAWPLPPFGYLGIQAGHHGPSMDAATYVLPLALEFVHAENCRVEQCRIEHTGACGVGFGAGCRRNVVVGCDLADIGGNGVMVGWRGTSDSHRIDYNGDESLSADWKDPANVPVGNAVVGCSIRNCGAVNHGCVGVWDGFCAETRIAHNVVTSMPYTGVSIGFRWNESETSQRGTVVEYNHIHDVMKMLADGGCIYTLGYQPGTVLRGNVLHDAHRSAYAHGGAPNNGIFFDQGTKGLHVEGNTVYGTSGRPVRFNQTNADNMTWDNNSFDVGTGYAETP